MVFTHPVSLANKFLKRGGMKAVVAENLLLKQQLLVLTRSRKRAPNLSSFDRFFLGLWNTFLDPRRIKRVALLVQPSTLLQFHQARVRKKYRLLFASPNRRKPGPKGPSRELIELVLGMKRRNPNLGYIKIAEQLSPPFIERLIGTIRREYLDQGLFWNKPDLERKLDAFKEYYRGCRIHQSLDQQTPEEVAGKAPPPSADPKHFVWQPHCQGLFQTPMAA